MKQAADWNGFTELVEALHGGLGLQDLDLNAVLGQDLKGFGTDLESLPNAV